MDGCLLRAELRGKKHLSHSLCLKTFFFNYLIMIKISKITIKVPKMENPTVIYERMKKWFEDHRKEK